MPHFIDRAKPGVIAVTADGKRFTNEGNSYHDFVKDMVAACANSPEVSAYLICDHRTLRKYGLGCVAPFPLPIGHYLRTGYLKRGATLAELAEKSGINANGLESTVREFNGPARDGKDPTFGKGSKAYNRYQGDALHSPNPCLAPLEHGPFYAIKVVVGDLGSLWTPALLNEAFRAVLDGAALVALQRDPYWLGATGLEMDAGPYVAAIEYAAGAQAELAGKPNEKFYHAALASLGRKPEGAAMIGDDIWSDVQGAQRAGLKGWLVRTGKFREDVLASSGVRPDRILDSLADLASELDA